MRNVQKLAGGIDTVAVVNALLRQPELWENGKIVLRGKTSEGSYANWLAFDMFPQLRQVIFGLMARIEGELLGDVVLWRVGTGGAAQLHSDEELYVVVLAAGPGAGIKVLGESAILIPGDVLWSLDCEAVNNSSEDLLLLQICASPNAPATYFPEQK